MLKLCCFNYCTSPPAEHLFHSVQVMCANVLNSCFVPWDRTVKVWDLNTGEETVSLGGHKRDVVAVRFCTRTQRVFSASQNLVKVTVNLWSYSVQGFVWKFIREGTVHLGEVQGVATGGRFQVLWSYSCRSFKYFPRIYYGRNIWHFGKKKSERSCLAVPDKSFPWILRNLLYFLEGQDN